MNRQVSRSARTRRDLPPRTLLDHDDIAFSGSRRHPVEHELNGSVEHNENHVSLRIDVRGRAATRWPLEHGRVEIPHGRPPDRPTRAIRQQPDEQLLGDCGLDRFEEHPLLEPDVPFEQFAEWSIRPIGPPADALMLEQRLQELGRLDPHSCQQRKNDLLLLTKMPHELERKELREPGGLTAPELPGLDERALVIVRKRDE